MRVVCESFEFALKHMTSLKPIPNAGVSWVKAKKASANPKSDAPSTAAAVRPFFQDGLRPVGDAGRHSGSTGSFDPVKNVESR